MKMVDAKPKAIENRTILHVDMDAFFVSVEELFDPSLRGKPVAVAGAGKRTIVTTSSYAARKRGVRTAMPLGRAMRICPELVVVRADFRKYSEASAKVFEVLDTFTDLVEPFSVDEAFIEATGLVERAGGARTLGAEVKRRILDRTGLTCSVGVAPNKLLAKLASGLEKPDGLTVLEKRGIPGLLEKTAVSELCGIGPKTTAALESMGIRTCGELGRAPVESLMARFGSSGESLSRMGRGEDDSPVVGAAEGEGQAKTIGHSATLPEDVDDPALLRQVLLTLSEMVGRRARKSGCAGRRVVLTVRRPDFTTFSRQVTLPSPVDRTEAIYREACGIFDALRPRKPVRLLGVTLGDLVFEERQLSLGSEEAKRDRIQAALDRINDRYGEGSAGPADLLRDLRGSWEKKKKTET